MANAIARDGRQHALHMPA